MSDVNIRPPSDPDYQEYDENHNLIAVSPKRRSETMAFALQSVVYNIGGNLFEPLINQRIQKYYSDHDPRHLLKSGSYMQNLTGELAGDLTGSGGLMIAEAVAPVALHTCTRKMRNMIDPLFSSIADQVFASKKNEPDYEEKKNEWKVAQERSVVRASIVTAGALVGNIASQKLMLGNPAPAKTIFLGKLASSVLTNSLGLIARSAFPEQAKGVDKWLGTNVFDPLFEDKQSQRKR